MRIIRFRVQAKCDKCNRKWVTRKKKNNNSPVRCKYCDSYKTQRLSYWEVQ